MMARPRSELHSMLKDCLGEHRNNCYYRPPSGCRMKYPCIRYDLSSEPIVRADNMPYQDIRLYTVTVIDEDPDSLIHEKVRLLPYTSLDRTYQADNLNHFVYSIYY